MRLGWRSSMLSLASNSKALRSEGSTRLGGEQLLEREPLPGRFLDDFQDRGVLTRQYRAHYLEAANTVFRAYAMIRRQPLDPRTVTMKKRRRVLPGAS